MQPLFENRKGLITGVFNKQSIAWAIAERIMGEGGTCGFSYMPDKPDDERKKNLGRITKLIEGNTRAIFAHPMDVTNDEHIAEMMRVVRDKPDYYCLETRFSVMGRGPLMFGAARKGKRYVSYHLVPLYMNQPLQNKVSAELKRRKQGKACFNFAKPDQTLFAELAKLTRLGFDCFKKLAKDSPS